MRFCEEQGFVARMTSQAHRSGTERVHEISTAISADVYLNVQGDEPLTRPEHIESLIAVMQGAGVEVGTLKTPAAEVDINNPSAVKVVTDNAGGRCIFRGLQFRMIAMACVRDITNILGSTAIARTRWTSSCAGRSPRSSAASDWSSCAFSRTGFRSTSQKRHSTPLAWTRKRTFGGWKRFWRRICNLVICIVICKSDQGRDGERATGRFQITKLQITQLPIFPATLPRLRRRRLAFRSQGASGATTRPSGQAFFRRDSARPTYSSTK